MYDSDEEVETGTSSEWMANNLSPGDNVVVPTAIDGEPILVYVG